MRLIYMDEAGISANEPVTVVAAIIIDGDRQFRAIECHLSALADKYVPAEKRRGFAFHAKELVNGGKTFVRGEYPDERRIEALHDVASIPSKALLPIAFGFHWKGEMPEEKELSPKKLAIGAQKMAFSQCAVAAEQYMRRVAPDEIAVCIAEDNDQAHNAVKEMQAMLMNPGPGMPASMADILPIGRIVDTVHFAKKSEAVILQVADICAYTLKRFLTGAPYSEELLDLMTDGKFPKGGQFHTGTGAFLFVPFGSTEEARKSGLEIITGADDIWSLSASFNLGISG